MQVNAQQFSSQLTKTLSPIYLICGDEILLANESVDAIRKKAKSKGFDQRQIFTVERGFDWNGFKTTAQSFSLFSDKTILELRNPSAKFDKAAVTILIEYLENPPEDKLLIIITNKLSGATKKTKWYKAVLQHGVVLPLWPLQGQQLAQFIQSRFKKYELNADTSCIRFLAELTQGNLLATDQAIQKLKLTLSNEKVTPEIITQVVNDSSRFSVFDWSQFLLLGNTKQALHCLDVLKLTGTEPVLLLWLLAKEVRTLYQYQITKQFKYEWPARQEQLRVAARRLPAVKLSQLLQQLSELDLMIKGLASGNVWNQFERITIALCQKQKNKLAY